MLQLNASLQLGNGPINGLLNFAGNTTNGLLNLAGNTANGLLGFAGNTANGLLNLAGNTVNGSLSLLSNALSGNGNSYSLSPGFGQGSYVAYAPQPMMSAPAQSPLSRLSDAIGNFRASNLQYRMMDYSRFSYPWSFGPYGMGFNWMLGSSPAFNDPMMYSGSMYPMYFGANNYGCSCPCHTHNMFDINAGPKMKSLDEVLYPSGDKGKDGKQKPAANGPDVETMDANGDFIRTPNWYKTIADKARANKPLTANEQKLKDSYERLVSDQQYCLYRLDKNGKVMTNSDGTPVYGPIADEIQRIRIMLAKGQVKSVESVLRNMPKEKRAAVEVWFSEIKLGDDADGMTLREAVKKSSLTIWGFSFNWTGINTSSAERIFDVLDESATENPQNMAFAMRQALQNHRMFGCGVDDDRIAKLLQMAAGNPEYLAAMESEYGGSLAGDIGDKWFVSDKNKSIISRILKV